MARFRKSIIIFGCIMLCLIGALAAFLTLTAAGMIEADSIKLTIKASDGEKEYDGTALIATEYTLEEGELLSGHELSVSYIGSQTDVGTSESLPDVKVLDTDGRDVTRKYGIRTISGKLKVNPRSLRITQEDVTRIYEGAEVEGGEYNIDSGELCPGHRIVRSNKDSGVINVGQINDNSEPLIFDISGNDVTDNYSIFCVHGKITVEPRILQIAPTAVTKTYDGAPLAPEYEITDGSLIDGHRMEVGFKRVGVPSGGISYTLLRAGSAEVEVDKATVYDADGTDVTANYLISSSVTSATITVTPCPLRIDGVGASFVYDGKSHDTADAGYTQKGLCLGDEISVEYTESVSTGYRENRFTYVVKNGKEDVSHCYDITPVFGMIRVVPRRVSVELNKPRDREYSGTALDFGDIVRSYYWVENDGGESTDGLGSLTAEESAALGKEIMNGISARVYRGNEEIEPGQAVNAGVYTYSVGVDNGDKFVLTNTSAELNGSVEIVAKSVRVTARAGLNSTYNGEKKTLLLNEVLDVIEVDAEFYETVSGMLYLSSAGIIKDADEYPFEIMLNDAAGNFVLSERATGVYTVNKAPIEIRTYNGETEKIYDGRPFEIDLSKINLSIADLRVTGIAADLGGADAGVKTLSVNYMELRDVYGNDVTKNYDFAGYRINGVINRKLLIIKAESWHIRGSEQESLPSGEFEKQCYAHVSVSLSNVTVTGWTLEITPDGDNYKVGISVAGLMIDGSAAAVANYDVRVENGTVTVIW